MRRREVKSAEQLIWMALMYSGMVGSLRGTAALGTKTGDFDINDTSVRYRLGQSVELLTAVLDHLLFGAARLFSAKGVRRRICLQDATVVTIPGSKGTDFRLHTEFIPGQGLAHVEITDSHGGESLERGQYRPGDIVIADQGLGHAKDMHHVVSTGADCLVRVYLQNLKLNDERGQRLAPSAILDLADRGVHSIAVSVPLGKAEPLQARLVLAKLPPEQAARARQRLKKRALKKQKGITDLALRLAGYVAILTTVTQSDLSDDDVLETYRLRWQIELFFKRCKSLLGLDELASGGRVAKAWLLGKMIIAALIDRAISKIVKQSCGKATLASANLWQLTRLCLMDLNATIIDVEGRTPPTTPDVVERLREAPRKRLPDADKINRLYHKLTPTLRNG